MAIDDLRRGVGGESSRPLGERKAPEPKPEAPRDYSAFGGSQYISRGKLMGWADREGYSRTGIYPEEIKNLISGMEKRYGKNIGDYFSPADAQELSKKLEYERPATREDETRLAKEKLILRKIQERNN